MSTRSQLDALIDVATEVLDKHQPSASLRGVSCRCGGLKHCRDHDVIGEHYLMATNTALEALGYELHSHLRQVRRGA